MAASPEPSTPRKQSPYNNYLKYSGLAIQLLATIGIAGWFGYLLDGWLDMKYPVFMITFGFIGFCGMMYQVYRSINQG